MGVPDREERRFDDRTQLRSWLSTHASSSPGIWLVLNRSAQAGPAPTYDEVVEEALCVGWIDSGVHRRDNRTNAVLLTPRRAGSTWARTNKARVERLAAAGLMTEAGWRVVDRAKVDGSWTALDAVERDEVPEDLATALDGMPAARAFFDAMPTGVRRRHVWFVVSAKRADTRSRRIASVVSAAARGRRIV
jgi:uncharacterized protein YdeI (YjbR/CyaY-like superfamily)